MLECKNLSVFYGQHHALDGVSVRIEPGEIVVILGANGAGKSTLLKAIGGIVQAESGSQILVNDVDITSFPAHEVVETGLALVPEGRGIFGELTVLENLKLGAFPVRAKDSEGRNLDRILTLFPKLHERRNQIVRTMSGGEQQMVAIGRAMMSAPSILMLDEPSLGLSPILCSELFKTLEEVRKTGVGILLVEQNAKQSLAIADRGYLLEVGRIVGEDEADKLVNDPAVQQAYLGGSASTSVSGQPNVREMEKEEQYPDQPLTGPAQDYAIRVQPRSRSEIASRQIQPDEISALVNRAVEVEASQQETRSTKNRVPSSGTVPKTSEPLKRVLEEIEQSARDARLKVERYENTNSDVPAGGENAIQPVIEVYRKPRIEIYERRRSKTGEKMVKVKR